MLPAPTHPQAEPSAILRFTGSPTRSRATPFDQSADWRSTTRSRRRKNEIHQGIFPVPSRRRAGRVACGGTIPRGRLDDNRHDRRRRVDARVLSQRVLHPDPECTDSEAPHGFDGFERGTYTWNPSTGAFSVTVLQDLNGDTGLSNLVGLSGVTIFVSGDTATASIPGNGMVSVHRVTGRARLVGAWGNCSTAPDTSSVLVFLRERRLFPGPGRSPAECHGPRWHRTRDLFMEPEHRSTHVEPNSGAVRRYQRHVWADRTFPAP